MCIRHHRHSIFCILPPYMLRAILANGSKAQKAAANRALGIDTTLRSIRSRLAVAQSVAERRHRKLALPPARQRSIHTAGNSESLPGRLVRAEGQDPSGDVAVDEAYDGLGHTFDFFLEAYRRNSIDDDGLALDATVHYGEDYNNAFWNGQRMVFGDGDGDLFNRFTASLDVIGHELGHGVTEDEAGLVYMQQPGALNEIPVRCLGIAGQAMGAEAVRRGGRLDHRRRAVHQEGAGRRPALDEGAGHRL